MAALFVIHIRALKNIIFMQQTNKFTLKMFVYYILIYKQHISAPTATIITVSCKSTKQCTTNFDVLLTVHLSIFISVFNQLDAQNLFHGKFYFMPLHVSSTCAHHQEVKIALHSLWYHHTYSCDDTRGCVMQF